MKQNDHSILATLFAKADAMRGMSDTDRAVIRAALFAEMAMVELASTAEKDVLRRIKAATGANLGTLEDDYRKVKGENSGDVVTEDKVALAFIDERGGGLRYCHTRGFWFLFDEKCGVWRKDNTRRTYDLGRRYSREAAKALGPKDKKSHAAIGRASFAAGVETLARADQRAAATIEMFDADPWLLGTPGGIVDLRSGEYVKAGREMLITRMMAVAPAEKVDCPRFLQFLREATRGDDAFIDHIQRTLGYALVGINPEQVLVFIYGPGGNGKGMLVSLMMWIFGDYAVTASMDCFTATKGDRHPTDLAMLAGARLVTATETRQGRTWDEQRLKQLTGGDLVSARFMHQNFFTFLPAFLPLISGNNKPRFEQVGEAERRRLTVWPFNNKPPKKDTQLLEKLQAEGPGILRWLIEGCVKWQAARDAGDDPLARPSVVHTATDLYFAEQETLRAWMEERCVIRPSAVAKPAALLDDFNKWAHRQGERVLRAAEFKDRFAQLGFTRKKVNGHDLWAGIALNDHEWGDKTPPGDDAPPGEELPQW